MTNKPPSNHDLTILVDQLLRQKQEDPRAILWQENLLENLAKCQDFRARITVITDALENFFKLLNGQELEKFRRFDGAGKFLGYKFQFQGKGIKRIKTLKKFKHR